MKSLFKILIIAILGLSVVGCELLDPKGWERAHQKAAERGRKCYETRSGYIYCEDKNGNRIY